MHAALCKLPTAYNPVHPHCHAHPLVYASQRIPPPCTHPCVFPLPPHARTSPGAQPLTQLTLQCKLLPLHTSQCTHPSTFSTPPTNACTSAHPHIAHTLFATPPHPKTPCMCNPCAKLLLHTLLCMPPPMHTSQCMLPPPCMHPQCTPTFTIPPCPKTPCMCTPPPPIQNSFCTPHACAPSHTRPLVHTSLCIPTPLHIS